MAQEVDIFKSAKPSAAFAALRGPQRESLADGIGQGYAVIGYRGKNWTIRHDGEVYAFTRTITGEDGTVEEAPMNYIDVIILRSPPNKSKSFYPPKEEGGGYDPDASDGKRPTCSSLDGIRPDDDVPGKQADLCAICPRNVWKTMPNGKKGQDCTDYKRLAVCILPALAKRVMGRPFQEPVFLRVPPASLAGLAKYGELADTQGFHYSELITRISFDPEAPTPKFLYKAIGLIGDQEAPFVLKLRESPLARRITGEDSHVDAVSRLSHAAPLAQLAKPEQAFVEEPKPAAEKPPRKQKAKPLPVISAKPVEPETIETGFTVLDGGNAAAELTVAAVPPAAVKQTPADTGEVTESDEALDAMVNDILAKK